MKNKDAKIYVAGHRGLVGSAVIRRLAAGGYTNIVTRTHAELDLTHQADAAVFLMETKNAADLGAFINIGTGVDQTIRELAERVRAVVYADAQGRTCRIRWDTTKPNGMPKNLLNVSRTASFGWMARTGLEEGLAKAYVALPARFS